MPPVADPDRTLASVRKLEMPSHHDVCSSDVQARRLGAVLALAHERDLSDFAELLLVEQLGPRTLQSLALVAEVVHGTPTRFEDPARFSFAQPRTTGRSTGFSTFAADGPCPSATPWSSWI